MIQANLRDNLWLEEKLYYLWEEFFADVARPNRVFIKFGKKSYRQLGCIKLVSESAQGLTKLLAKYPKLPGDDPKISLITITGYYRDPTIPDDVVMATIAHEMCHYTHGFNSPLTQIYAHPHRGRVIDKELAARGLGPLHKFAESWLKQNWRDYIRAKITPR